MLNDTLGKLSRISQPSIEVATYSTVRVSYTRQHVHWNGNWLSDPRAFPPPPPPASFS